MVMEAFDAVFVHDFFFPPSFFFLNKKGEEGEKIGCKQ
jgi:hypothetical protein